MGENILDKNEESLLIEETKKISIKEAGAYSIMDGFGVRYVTPYTIALGASNSAIAILSSVPGLIGNFFQLSTIKLMKKFDRKKVIFLGVLLQALMWPLIILAGIPFFIFGVNNSLSPNLVIIIYTLLVLFGAISGPAWTSMMKDLITTKRGEYFSKRSRVAGIVVIISMFIAGFILDYFKQTKIFLGFIILFIIAFIGRFISAMLLKKHYSPKFEVDDGKYFTIVDFIKKMRHNNFGRFVLYFSLVTFACAIASPFFTVYEFSVLGFTYKQYMFTVIANSLTTILLIPLWGKFSDKYGNLKTMKITGALIPLLPFLWLFTLLIHNPIGMVVLVVFLEIYSGTIWSGFNLAAGNFIYDAVTKERITICASYFNIINAFWNLIGSLIGGYLSSKGVTIGSMHPIIFLFILSGIARIIVYFIMSGKIKEVREIAPFSLSKHLHNKFKEAKKPVLSFFNSIWKRGSSLSKFIEAGITDSVNPIQSSPLNLDSGGSSI